MTDSARSAADYLPPGASLDELRRASAGCRGCDLYVTGSQTVFGAGPEDARLVLVGEEPGDKEDLEGLPFIGPAGHVLDKALLDLGIARDKVYLTNAVKHFKWTPRGKRRIHQSPRAGEIRACRPWLEAELDRIRPDLVVCLGATAVESLLGASAKVMRDRGRVLESACGPCLVTIHPSAVLRVEDGGRRQEAYGAFLADLRAGLAFLERSGKSLRR